MTGASIRHEIKILAAVLFLALGLRVWGIQFGLPGLYHADEPIVLNHALAYGTGDLNPHFFKIPPLVSYLLFGVFGVYYVAGLVLGQFSGTADFENLFYTDPSSFYLLARLVFGALAGTLTVLAFYGTVRRHFGWPRALTSAFLLAICFLHVTDSHYLYADIPLLLVSVIAFGFFWNLQRDSKLWQHMAAGGVIGLAAALKYNGLFVGLFYGVMLMGTKMRPMRKMTCCLLAAGASGMIFSLLNPYWLLDFNFFVEELKKQSLSQGGVGWLHHGVYSLPGALGLPVLCAAMAGGALFFLIKQSDEDRLKRAALLLFTVGYYAILARAGQPYPRYVLLLLPGIIFFAADFLDIISKGPGRRWIFATGILILSGFPLIKSILWCQLMSAPDTRAEAKSWVENHLPQGTALALEGDFYMPRLNFSPSQLQAKKQTAALSQHFGATKIRRLETLHRRSLKEPSYDLHFLVPEPLQQERFLLASPVLDYDFEALRSQSIRYVFTLPGFPKIAKESFYQRLRHDGQLVKTFSPYKDERLKPLDGVAMTGGPFTWPEIVQRRSNGHAIQVFRLEGMASS